MVTAAALALTACSALERIPGGSYLEERAGKNAERVGTNAVGMAVRGDLGKRATFTMEQEFHLGRTIAARVVGRLGGRALPPDHATARYLRNVGTVLALAAAELRVEDDRPYPFKGFRFLLVDAPSVNAVGAPGGFVLVTTGAVRAARSEDELAAIVAHEIAHVQKGHAIGPVESAREQEHLTASLLEGTDDVVHAFFGKVVNLGTELVLDRGYGKQHELEADAFAARILGGAGYDPGALAAILSRLAGKAAEGGFFSRHPPASDRVSNLATVEAKPTRGHAARALRLAAATKALGEGERSAASAMERTR
jgi:predicted Zn-dependent protease